MAVEKKTTEKLVQTVRAVLPGLKDKTAGMYAHFRENPKEFLSQKPVAWTLGIVGLVVGTILLVGMYKWLQDFQTTGDKTFKTASRIESLLVIDNDGGEPFTIRQEGLSGNGPFVDQRNGKQCWRALLSPDGQYYSAKPGPDGKPEVPAPLPTPTPLPTPKTKNLKPL